MKKILVIGGTKGLGKTIVEYFNGLGIGRSNGFDIDTEYNKIEVLSKSYDIVVNCIPTPNQLELMTNLMVSHTESKLSTYFITLGSMRYKIEDEDHFKVKLVHLNDYFLLQETTVKHTLINPAAVFNSPNTEYFERITEPEFINMIEFLISTSTWKSTINMIEMHGAKLSDV
jgi:hypothetical protein